MEMDGKMIKILDVIGDDPLHPNKKVQINKYASFSDRNPDSRKIIVSYEKQSQVPRDVIEFMTQRKIHDNILQLVKHPENPLCVYSSYVELSLHDLIYENKFLYPSNTISKAYFVVQLVQGVTWLHQNLIFHGFLNPEVVYLENYYTVKIGGFYFSERFQRKDQLSTKETRSLYYPPTQAEQNRLGLKYDIWCLGRVIFEFIFQESASQLFELNFNENWEDYLNKPEANLDVILYRFYQSLSDDNYEKRPYIDEIQTDNKNVNEKIISNFMEKKFEAYEKKWSFKVINRFTSEMVHENTKRCLKKRPFIKKVYDFQRELTIFKDSSKHHEQFAVLYYEDIVSPNKSEIWLITEFAKHGCLKQKLKLYKKTGFPPDELENYVKELIRILALMHEKNIIHRNLKPTNVLLVERNKQITLRFCDFYTAKSNVGETIINNTSIPKSPYTAPELYDQENSTYGKPADVWSIGCIIHEMKCMRREYNGQTKPDHIPSNLENEKTTNDPILTLCQKMIVLDPENRAKANEL